MPSRSTNTMQEALQRVLSDLAVMKTLPDADLEFIVNLETTVLQKLREPIDNIARAGLTNAPPQMGPGGAGGANPSMVGAGVPGIRSEPQINPDELRRMIQQ